MTPLRRTHPFKEVRDAGAALESSGAGLGVAVELVPLAGQSVVGHFDQIVEPVWLLGRAEIQGFDDPECDDDLSTMEMHGDVNGLRLGIDLVLADALSVRSGPVHEPEARVRPEQEVERSQDESRNCPPDDDECISDLFWSEDVLLFENLYDPAAHCSSSVEFFVTGE